MLKLLLEYFRTNLKLIVMLLIFAAIFLSISVLSGIPQDVIAYAILLCSFIGMIFAVYGFIRSKINHNELVRLQTQRKFVVADLPYPSNQAEQDYHELLSIVMSDCADEISAADASKSDMLEYYTLWTHQIKTPISAMKLLLSDCNDTEASSKLNVQLMQIEQYIDMALSYTKLDTGAGDFVIRYQPLEPIVNQAVRKLAPLFISKRLKLNIGKLDVKVVTDEKWLSFVIEQILSNSLKYTKSGSITISILNENTLKISDTGIGIEKSDLARIFEKGFTGCNGRMDKRATGIGLYLSKRILDSLGHDIAVESTVGVGTDVLLKLDILSQANE